MRICIGRGGLTFHIARVLRYSAWLVADAGNHSVAIRLRGGNGKQALADLQDNLATQDALIQTQRQQIAALQADSRKQQSQINWLSEQVESQTAQLQAQRKQAADHQAQLVSFIERAITLISLSHNDMMAQLWDSLRDLPGQHADTEPIIAVEHEQFAPPADEPAPETDAPQSPAEIAALYSPLEIAADEDPEPQEVPAPIPPRPPADEQLKTMRRFIDAGIRFVDYIGEDLPKSHVNRLEEQGKLERHKFHPYKLRPTSTGRKWFEQATLPAQDEDEYDDEDTQPTAAIDTTVDDELEIAEIAPTAEDLADDIPALDSVVGEVGSDSAQLLTLLLALGGSATPRILQKQFPPHKFVSVMVDDINEAAFDLLDENLIMVEDGKLVLDDAYNEELIRCLDVSTGGKRESDSGEA